MRHAARRRPRHRSVSVSIASSSPAGAMVLEGVSNLNVSVSVTGGPRRGGAPGAYERRVAPDRGFPDDRSGSRRPTRDTSLGAGDSLRTKSASGPIGLCLGQPIEPSTGRVTHPEIVTARCACPVTVDRATTLRASHRGRTADRPASDSGVVDGESSSRWIAARSEVTSPTRGSPDPTLSRSTSA